MWLKRLFNAILGGLKGPNTAGERFQDRVPMKTMSVVVTWSFGGKADGILYDKSDEGLGMKLTSKAPTNERVRVELGSTAFYGRIRYCKRGKDGQYVTGFRME